MMLVFAAIKMVEVEVDLSDGEVALNQIGALPGRLSVTKSCVLREHSTGTPASIYVV